MSCHCLVCCTAYVRFWHIADIRCGAMQCPLLEVKRTLHPSCSRRRGALDRGCESITKRDRFALVPRRPGRSLMGMEAGGSPGEPGPPVFQCRMAAARSALVRRTAWLAVPLVGRGPPLPSIPNESVRWQFRWQFIGIDKRACDDRERGAGWPIGRRGGRNSMKKLLLALVFWGSALCTPVFAKTFVGVMWPMFGPLPAIGLVELVAELKLMPDVEVSTYLHQSWPALVEDIEHQPPGTRTVVVGYSLGANSSVFVANQAKYIDVIIALQPSMLSWNPAVTGSVGRMIEVYNPDPSMTFGGMGSKKLIGPNIEYIANNDSHPGAQFSSEFRNLVKSEIARVSA